MKKLQRYKVYHDFEVPVSRTCWVQVTYEAGRGGKRWSAHLKLAEDRHADFADIGEWADASPALALLGLYHEHRQVIDKNSWRESLIFPGAPVL